MCFLPSLLRMDLPDKILRFMNNVVISIIIIIIHWSTVSHRDISLASDSYSGGRWVGGWVGGCGVGNMKQIWQTVEQVIL